VELPWAPNATCFTIENVLSDDECEQLIALSEERRGYEQALVNVGDGQQAVSDVRQSSRWMVDSESAADELWRRIERHVPDVVKGKRHDGRHSGTTVGWYASGLNERLRFLKYNPGDYFAPHQDGSFQAEPGEVSRMTVMLYLNSAGKGGETKFLNPHDENDNKTVDVVPRRGLCLVFDHWLLHEGALLLKGVKYAPLLPNPDAAAIRKMAKPALRRSLPRRTTRRHRRRARAADSGAVRGLLQCYCDVR